MREVTFHTAIKSIQTYVNRLQKENKLTPKTDEFMIVFPLAKRQVIILEVTNTEEGRKVTYQVSDNAFFMKKAKNISLTTFSGKGENHA